MKHYIVIFGLSLISSCAFMDNPSKSLGFLGNRELAQSTNQCVLVKHAQEPIYQIQKNGVPLSEFWYDEAWALKKLEQHKEQCLE